jgi:hypothetical protein
MHKWLTLSISEVAYFDLDTRFAFEHILLRDVPANATVIDAKWVNTTGFEGEPRWDYVVFYEEAHNG